MSRAPQSWITLGLFCSLMLAGCGSGLSVKKYEYLSKAPAVRAVVILQPECYFRNMASYQVYQTWNDLAREFTQRSGVIIIGPDEYRVLVKGLLTNLVQETDLEVVLARYGVKPDEAVAIRTTLTESWQQAERAIINEDGSRGLAAEFESKFEFGADVYHVGTSRPLLSLVKNHEVRGSQLPTSSDARPEFTQFARSSYGSLVEQLLVEMKLASGSVLGGISVLESPLQAIEYAFQELPPLSVKLEQLDEMDRDARVQGLIEHRAPSLERGLLRQALKAEPGLLVTVAPGCSNLQAGDLLLQADGEVIFRPYQLLRSAWAALRSGKPLALRFRRGAEEFQSIYSCGEAAH